MSTKVVHRWDKVRQAGERADFKNLGHAGAVVRKVAGGSIRVGKTPSAPGSPPHTKRRALSKGILFAVEGNGSLAHVLIGPAASVVGDSGKAHEFGGRYRGQVYDKRPFMNPALGKVLGQIPPEWESSYKE